MKRPIAIDLFAGAGGLSLGFEQAGFDIAAAVEVDPIHAAIHHYNFPYCTVIPQSVAGLSGKEIRQRANLASEPIDVVCGGPPCQGFSLIGHRAMNDPRNSLVKEFVRLVAELSPSFFVFENVKGLTVGKHRGFLEEIISAFVDIGYNICQPWKVLNAVNYGVPQSRERLILLGAKTGLALPTYPQPITRAADSKSGLLPAGPSCYDALRDLPDADSFPQLANTDEIQTGSWGKASEYGSKLRSKSATDWEYGYKRHWNPSLLTCSLRTEHSDISRMRFAQTEPGTIEPISRFFRLPKDGVSNTLRAGTDSARGAFTSPRPIHYEKARCITVREMARLHGFPDWFRFHSTKWHGARQIGNSVPPPLARAIAFRVIKALGTKPHFPANRIQMGDERLLRFDMSEASHYWQIEVPIAKRDRKSGARKRKQSEIENERQGQLAYG